MTHLSGRDTGASESGPHGGGGKLGQRHVLQGAAKAADPAGLSFGDVLKNAVGGVLDAGRKSDAQTVAMASGKANVMDVVTAVAETDVAVSTLVSVRDKVIAAYEDIMKMTI